MDNFSVQGSSSPTDKSLVFSEKDPAIFFAKIKNLFNRKIVKITIALVIILIIAIPIGLFVNQKYTENKRIANSYQNEKQRRINTEKIIIGESGMIGFFGEVKKIQANEIILQTKNGLKTIKVVEDTAYREIPFVLDEKKDKASLVTKKTTFSKIKVDDFVDIVGSETENVITARIILIYNIP